MSQSETAGVWIDYENARHAAAACFLAEAAGMDSENELVGSQPGHFWPLALARRLLARPVAVPPGGRSRQQYRPRTLVRVEAFMGMPDRSQRPALAWYVERMAQAWSRQGVNVTMLPTWRTSSGGEIEKGIDVSLAMSVQEAALRHEVDVVVLVSADNDLLPVVYELHPRRSYRPTIELAAWRGPSGGQAMRAPVGVLTHLLDGDDYTDVAANLVRDFGRPAGASHGDGLESSVVTLADRLADVGLAVKVGPLRPIPAGHAMDGSLWRPQPATIRRVTFGTDGVVPAHRPRPTVIVVQSSAALPAAPPLLPVREVPSPAPPEVTRRPAWWRRALAAVCGRARLCDGKVR